jgi:DUF1680 family protein
VRVPEWAPQMTARLSTGEKFTAKGGEYLRVTRLWKRDDRVEVAMDPTLRFANGGRSYPGRLAVSADRWCSLWKRARTSNFATFRPLP